MNVSKSNRNIFAPLGASNHVDHEREENDFYATDPRSIDALLSVEDISSIVWENAAGDSHLANRLIENGFSVRQTDLVIRNKNVTQQDFLTQKNDHLFCGDIITNPPYKFAGEWVTKSLDAIHEGQKVCLFLKLTFLESAKRRVLFDVLPPLRVHVFSKRIACAKNGEFEGLGSSAACYAWFVWEKGNTNKTTIGWI